MRLSPLNFELLAGLQGGPSGIGDNGDAGASVVAAARARGVAELMSEVDGGEFEDSSNARKGLDFVGIETVGFAAVDGAALDRNDEHAGNTSVDAESGGAVDFGERIGAAGGLAYQSEFSRRLERRVGRRLKLRRCRDELGKGQFSLRWSVDDGALLRAAL